MLRAGSAVKRREGTHASVVVREIARFILNSQPSPPPPKVAFVTAREADFGMARKGHSRVIRGEPAEMGCFRVTPPAPAAASSGEPARRE